MKPIQGNNEEYRWISSSKILVSPVYQRRFKQSKVDDIVNHFDRRKVNPPKVSFRDGKFYVFDGQHTIAALKVINGGKDLMVFCRVYYGLTEIDEAELFTAQNGEATPVLAYEKLRSEFNTGKPEVTDMVRACESVGMTVDFINRNKAAYHIQAVKTIYDIYNKLGRGGLISVLLIIKDAWAGIPDSLTREIISGVALFCSTYSGQYQRKRLVDKLKRVDPVSIAREARSITSRGAVGTARVILRIYNTNASKKTYIEGRI